MSQKTLETKETPKVVDTRKTVAVVTSTRAEYGLLQPVLHKLEQSESLRPLLVVTGTHLCEEYGNTVSEIEEDSLPIAARIPILKFGHDSLATANTAAYAIQQFAAWFEKNRPDAVLVLGDRYETFAVALAATFQGVPVVHISGGDITRGAADDYYRHCITKLAHLHFPSCEDSARRIVDMGEAPDTVFNVGGLGDENLRSAASLSRQGLADSLGFDLTNDYALVTLHPETAGRTDNAALVEEMLAAMDSFSAEHEDFRWLVTMANADAEGDVINARVAQWVALHTERALLVPSLGMRRYLAAMRHAAFVAGNSSSGVVETPTFGVPSVNVGHRQDGRAMCDNVLSCQAERADILAAFERAVSPEFMCLAHEVKSPYNGGDTSGKIVAQLEKALASPGFGAPKEFYERETPRTE